MSPPTTTYDLDTPLGPGRAQVCRPPRARGVLAIGHGAGPNSTTVDLIATRDAAVAQGWAVALIEQPWLVAGRRVAPRPVVLDQAWVPMVRSLLARRGPLARVPGPLVVAGRSAGARVACRTAAELDAYAAVCLSFPLHPPGRPERSRADELALPLAAGRSVGVIQGERDPFGTPDELITLAPAPDPVIAVPGTHTIPARAAAAVAEAVRVVLAAVGSE
ncbi:MAG: hypothetical protein CSA84_02880 [Actinomycetales bacterium]|nr:MAG: hypothetical protein CSA84_02880 [Actinomycetales bacterium]